MTTPCTIHRRGTLTLAGVDLHLGQKPKLGGRYTGITHSLHITIVGHLYILVSLLLVVSLSVIFISVGSYKVVTTVVTFTFTFLFHLCADGCL